MPDPYIVVATALFVIAAFGLGYHRGQENEKRRVMQEIVRLARLRKEGLLP